MATKLLCNRICPQHTSYSFRPPSFSWRRKLVLQRELSYAPHQSDLARLQSNAKTRLPVVAVSAAMQPLDLTEANIEKVLEDARAELAQLFDASVGITGQAELAEVDGPFVKIRLKGRFWHKRSTVLARLENYLKQRIPEILEVDIEDENQLDDSPANF